MKPNRRYIPTAFFSFLLIFLLFTTGIISLAGDIPEVLAYDWETELYFGEIQSMDEEGITIIQIQKIKGDFTEGAEVTYPADIMFTDAPQVGSIYLCGYLDENNPVYIWETDSLDPRTLTIVNEDDMSKRMQQYLNDGTVQETENERLAYLDFQKENAAEHQDAQHQAAQYQDAQAKAQTSGTNSVSAVGGAVAATTIALYLFVIRKRE